MSELLSVLAASWMFQTRTESLFCYHVIWWSQLCDINTCIPGFNMQDLTFCVTPGKKKKKTHRLQKHQWHTERSDRQTLPQHVSASVYPASSLTLKIASQSIRWSDFEKLCLKNPISSCLWPRAIRVSVKTPPNFSVSKLRLIKSGFVEYPLSVFLFQSSFHLRKPYWFLQLLLWPQELNNRLQLPEQHLPAPGFTYWVFWIPKQLH